MTRNNTKYTTQILSHNTKAAENGVHIMEISITNFYPEITLSRCANFDDEYEDIPSEQTELAHFRVNNMNLTDF